MNNLDIKPEYRARPATLTIVNRSRRYFVPGVVDPLWSVTQHNSVIEKGGLVQGGLKRVGEHVKNRLMAMEKGNTPGEDGYEAYLDKMIAWAKRNVWGTSADDGTATHAIIEAWLTGQPTPEYPPDVMERIEPAVRAGKQVVEGLGIEIMAIELPIWHPEHLYAGTIDMVAKIRSELFILDWKRAKDLYEDNTYQVAAYAQALRKQLVGEPEVGAIVVRLPQEPDQGYETRMVEVEPAFTIYLAAKNLHEALQANKKGVWVK